MNKNVTVVFNLLSLTRFGMLAFGVYPLGLELSVEATYPLDEATGTVLIFLSGQIQGAILIIFAGVMAEELDDYGLSIEVRLSDFLFWSSLASVSISYVVNPLPILFRRVLSKLAATQIFEARITPISSCCWPPTLRSCR